MVSLFVTQLSSSSNQLGDAEVPARRKAAVDAFGDRGRDAERDGDRERRAAHRRARRPKRCVWAASAAPQENTGVAVEVDML